MLWKLYAAINRNSEQLKSVAYSIVNTTTLLYTHTRYKKYLHFDAKASSNVCSLDDRRCSHPSSPIFACGLNYGVKN